MAFDKETRIKSFVLLLKILTLVGVVVFIYLKLRDNPEIAMQILPRVTKAAADHYLSFIGVIILMPLNWFTEAYKWKLLAQPVQSIQFKDALKGVLSGLSLAFITPHGIGDYIGRITMINANKRTKLIGAIFIGRAFQLLATLVFGLIGLNYLSGPKFLILGVLIISFGILSIFLLIRQPAIKTTGWVKRLLYYFDVVRDYDIIFLSKICLLSCFRYIIFSTQFILLLSVFLPLTLYDKIAATTWILLAKSVLPSFNFLSDLGVREASALYFFENAEVELLSLLSATLTLWFINILVPTLMGVPLILQLKYKPS